MKKKNNNISKTSYKKLASSDYAVIDLFCGIGGLTHGFVKENFNVVAGIDIDETCRYAYEENNNAAFINKKIEDVTGEYLKSLYPKGSKKILIGCAPCQPFSKYTSKVQKDEKWGLLYHFARLIREVKPDIVSMENVPDLIRHSVYKDFISELERLEYNVTPKIVNCDEYGVPQKRRRLVLLASKRGDIELIKETHKNKPVTVSDIIRKLKPISAGETCKTDKLHKARKLDHLNELRIKNTPKGGSWLDWPKDLVLKCHKRKTGKTYRNVYGRMEWNKPAPTMTTLCCGLGNGRFGHPEQDRAISLREAALFQSFPKYYKFVKSNETAKFTLGRHIGNAVPVKLGKIIAKSIKQYLINYAQ